MRRLRSSSGLGYLTGMRYSLCGSAGHLFGRSSKPAQPVQPPRRAAPKTFQRRTIWAEILSRASPLAMATAYGRVLDQLGAVMASVSRASRISGDTGVGAKSRTDLREAANCDHSSAEICPVTIDPDSQVILESPGLRRERLPALAHSLEPRLPWRLRSGSRWSAPTWPLR